MKRIKPKQGQESVWDYPRPPKLERCHRKISLRHKSLRIDSTGCFRLLETSHPPSYYIPRKDISMDQLLRIPGKNTFCEWKGLADYWAHVEEAEIAIAWSYPAPNGSYGAIKDYLSFYAGRVEACFVDAERVIPQEGDFYGGWITNDIVGPFKGGKGTWGW